METTTCTQCHKEFPFKDRFWLMHNGKEVELCTPKCLAAWRQDNPPPVERVYNSRIQHYDGGGRAAY